jgi:uncharacterized protein
VCTLQLFRRPVRLVASLATAVALASCGQGVEPGDAAGPDVAPPSAADREGLESPTAVPRVPPLHPEVDTMDATVVFMSGRGGATDARVDVRVAATDAERQRGLMHVPDLPDGTGMLFVFEAPRAGGFWMKDTLVPLDIAFADGAGTILAVLRMEPCEVDPCPSYDPEVAYTYALEVPAGWFARTAVEVGDRLRWDEPVPAAPVD